MQMCRGVIRVLRSVYKNFLTLLYPRTCCFCGKVSTKELCDSCVEKVIYIAEPRCKQCGKPVRYAEQEYCHDCEGRHWFYEQGRSLWVHKEPVSDSIYRFKYKNKRIYAEFYAAEWQRLYGNLLREWGIDVIVPVPLHPLRKRLRGYNQAEVLAKQLGKRTGIPVESYALRRRYNTKPQKRLDDRQRRRNLREAFVLKKSWEEPKRILVIDDIYTTGSTIDSIAQILSQKGKNKVWFLTISIGQGF